MNRVDVAIVGAGAAGIAAAGQLIAAGRSVTLLEARDRVGGRAHTIRWQGQPIDTGAAWLHFAADNAFTGLAEQAGFTVIRRDPNWGAGARIGGRVPTAEERERAARDLQRYEALITAAADAGRDVALSEVLPHDHYRQRFDSVMTWAVGAESREISTLDYARYADSLQNWAVAEGLGSVVAAAANGLPVIFGASVQKITVHEDSVRVDTTAGSVEAGAVIVTVPTSVLAAGAITFDPPLPPAFTAAFEALPLGIVNKVFLSLPQDAIPSSETTQMIGSETSARTASYTLRPAGAPLISAFFGGDLSRELGAKHQLAEFAREELRQMLGSAVTDRITAAFETDWEGDPFARGSYSAARPGHADARDVVSHAVSHRLCFAGESCSREYYGTLHGAWLSGCAAAAHLLR